MSVEELVRRLRKKQERVHDLSGVGYMDDPDCQEAADKLEELAAENEAARIDIERHIDGIGKAEAALAEAKRENEALREALEQIEQQLDYGQINMALHITRLALEGGEANG